jgi:hypothetical protein
MESGGVHRRTSSHADLDRLSSHHRRGAWEHRDRRDLGRGGGGGGYDRSDREVEREREMLRERDRNREPWFRGVEGGGGGGGGVGERWERVPREGALRERDRERRRDREGDLDRDRERMPSPAVSLTGVGGRKYPDVPPWSRD